MTISNVLNLGAKLLSKSGVAEPRREASSLLTFVLKKEAVFLIAHPEYELEDDESDRFDETVRRRAMREPFQYIVGHQEFYGLEFEVEPGVLIPRPETEILVEEAIAILSKHKGSRFYEIGVGSGCISVSILHVAKSVNAVGVDISRAALNVTARNAEKHRVADRLTLKKTDVFEEPNGLFDLIVSNPPYIPDGDRESMQAEVVRFEPHTALFGGTDGLSFIRRIVNGAPQYLKPEGFLLIEIGFGQAAKVKDLFDSARWEDVEFLADMQDIPRIVRTQFKG